MHGCLRQSSSLIKTALHVLADGRTRDAGDILSEATKAGLHIKSRTRPAAVSADAIAAIAHRLHSTSTSTLPESFEKAVCDAFGALGFVATHHGGIGAPDGIIEAPLGPLAFPRDRRMQDGAAGGTVNAPRLEEPAKFRDAYKARFAVFAGPALSVDSVFESEMQTHAVSVWTVDDIVNALRLNVGPLECRNLFAAGIVEDRLADLAWDNEHGEEKRLAVIASVLHTTAWNAQKALVGRVDATDAPALTIDAALMLVDTALQQTKATGGATRAEVETAIADLVRAGIASHVPGRRRDDPSSRVVASRHVGAATIVEFPATESLIRTHVRAIIR